MLTIANLKENTQVYRVINEVLAEIERARKKFNPINSAHEGHNIIREELEEFADSFAQAVGAAISSANMRINSEFWRAVKADDKAGCMKEARQLAAMALAFLIEVPNAAGTVWRENRDENREAPERLSGTEWTRGYPPGQDARNGGVAASGVAFDKIGAVAGAMSTAPAGAEVHQFDSVDEAIKFVAERVSASLRNRQGVMSSCNCSENAAHGHCIHTREMDRRRTEQEIDRLRIANETLRRENERLQRTRIGDSETINRLMSQLDGAKATIQAAEQALQNAAMEREKLRKDGGLHIHVDIDGKSVARHVIGEVRDALRPDGGSNRIQEVVAATTHSDR